MGESAGVRGASPAPNWKIGWREHSVEEQKLFLSMMHRAASVSSIVASGREEGEAEYIAPDLLPDRAEIEVELEQKWDTAQPSEVTTFEYAMLHPGLMRSVISRIGGEAGIAAEYWKGGVYAYEMETRSRGLIEEEMVDTWRGRIRVQTQSGQAAVLLQRLRAIVEEEQNRAGMTSVQVSTTADRTRNGRGRNVGCRSARRGGIGGSVLRPGTVLPLPSGMSRMRGATTRRKDGNGRPSSMACAPKLTR